MSRVGFIKDGMINQAEVFDYIVVGAGSAGCVLGARLSEKSENRVLVLEAGGNDWMPLYKVPLMAGILFRHKYNNWDYETDQEPGLDVLAAAIERSPPTTPTNLPL